MVFLQDYVLTETIRRDGSWALIAIGSWVFSQAFNNVPAIHAMWLGYNYCVTHLFKATVMGGFRDGHKWFNNPPHYHQCESMFSTSPVT